jgi:hypothetical protein
LLACRLTHFKQLIQRTFALGEARASQLLDQVCNLGWSWIIGSNLWNPPCTQHEAENDPSHRGFSMTRQPRGSLRPLIAA